MLRSFAALVALLVLLAPLTVTANLGADPGGLDLVGYSKENATVARLAIVGAGGQILRSSPELGFSVVYAEDRARFEAIMNLHAAIDYVERDDETALAAGAATAIEWSSVTWNGAQWNGAQWNGAQWNAGQWNGGQWNAGQWNGGQWNAGQWNAAQWNAFRASIGLAAQHFSTFRFDRETTDPGLLWQWGAWSASVPPAWEVSTGSLRAKLCVLDSGVAYDHPDLAPNMWRGLYGEHGMNFIDPTRPPYDDAGHGTHIAGVAAARVGNAYGVAGMGNVQIISVKVLDETGRGLEDQLAMGIAYCANQGADVAVMALGVTEPGPTLDRAIQYAVDRDVLLVASSGNSGPCASCVGYPASDARVLAVTAMTWPEGVAEFASTGPEVDLAAPGVDILGPFPGGSFMFGSGTSQASAVVAGVAALLRDADPSLSAEATSHLLTSTARDSGPPGTDILTGSGIVDAWRALEATHGG